jgi:hypothetical protein
VNRFQRDQRVTVFDPLLQHLVAGTVLTATTGCVLVALDDRMVPLAVDPADHFRIQLVTAVADA